MEEKDQGLQSQTDWGSKPDSCFHQFCDLLEPVAGGIVNVCLPTL